MANEVKIKLTDEQKAKIKKGTGKDLSEIRVSAVGKQASARFVATRAQLNPTRAQLNPTRAQMNPTRANVKSTRYNPSS